jgi:hypothetical protein
MVKWVAESAFSLFFLTLGIVFWVSASPLAMRRSAHLIGPAHFPRILSVFLILLAGINLFRVISQRAENCNKLSLNMRVIAGTGLFALYIYLIPICGYFYVTPVFAVCIMLLMEYRKPLQIFLLSGGFTLAAYVIFYRMMAVRVPV